jgi:hypothetical protein
MLGYFSFYAVSNVYALFFHDIRYLVTHWVGILDVLEIGVILAILVGLWKWKKLAVYALIPYMLYAVLTLVMPINGFQQSDDAEIALYYAIGIFVPFLLLLWAIRSKWELFK